MKSIPEILAEELGQKLEYVQNVVNLMDEGNTIPFIARYRKEMHGAMDDTTLRNLETRLTYLRNLQERRDEVKKSIENQGKLTQELSDAIDSAATVAAVAKLRQVYMGTENIDGELAGIKTYPAKAADELYNKYIFDRSYAPEDMAKALRAYEGWKLKLFSAPDLDGVEAVYADARKAMDALTRDFTTGDTAPDMDTAASAARALARQEVLDSLAMLEQGYIDALTAIAGDMDALSYAWKARLTAVLDSGKAALHAAATPALEDIDDYGVLEDKLATGKQALSDIFADVSARLTALAASAANESAWNGTTVEPGKDASGVYQIGTAEELAWLAAEINNSSNNSQSYSAVLTADIDLGIGSMIAGLGGLYYVMDYANGVWSNNAFGDRGWLAIALVIFTIWRPNVSILASILFGGLYILNIYLPTGAQMAVKELYKMLPYVITLIVLIIVSLRKKREDQPPASLGLSYFREER